MTTKAAVFLRGSIKTAGEEKQVNCPNLLEWTLWRASFCRLRYEKPHILKAVEIMNYCKNVNHIKCSFYLEQGCENRKGIPISTGKITISGKE